MHQSRVSRHALWALLICALLLVSTAWASPRSEADATWLDVPTLIQPGEAPQAAPLAADSQVDAPSAERVEHPHSWALAAIPDALAPPIERAVVDRAQPLTLSAGDRLFLRLCVLRL